MRSAVDNEHKSSPARKKTFARNSWLIALIIAAAGFNSLPSFSGGPADMNKVLQKGFTDLGQGLSQEALDFFQSKLKKYPNSAMVHLGMGKALKRLGKLSEAKAEFRRATEVEPSYADGYYELGVCMESDREYAGAVDAFQKYLQLKPDAGERQAISDRIRYCQSQKS